MKSASKNPLLCENRGSMGLMVCPPCNIHRFDSSAYCSSPSLPSIQPCFAWRKNLMQLCAINCNIFSSYCLYACESVSVRVCVFAYCLFICPPEQGVFSHLWPLQVQGWHAITKTALSITLTDRLKRGFNSNSSPWALHHRGLYPSTPLLSPFIVSSCQSLGGLAKWPLLLLRSCYCVLAYPLVVG